ncbi:hypothetical protein AB1Y20_001982 [Prymnesium parvum]|uniref:Peptidase S54 rhomboid domain-containing protein n=1 Tax=Prymnesium parvum TaxID=97485 RepID=A0AB34J7U1_PRYPA
MADDAVPHFVGAEGDYISKRCLSFPPVVTLIGTVLILVLHFTTSPADRSSWRYGRPALPNVEWYASLSAVFAHVDDQHVLYNAANLAVVGTLFELSEGPARLLAVCWSAATVGFASHGAMSESYAVGASGVIYGITWSQVAILTLNWAEMPYRLVRLGLSIALAVVETVTYNTAYKPTIAYFAHWGGAAAGVVTSIVLAANIKLRRFEVYLNWCGVVLYAMLLIIFFGLSQYYASALASALLPVLTSSAAQQTSIYWRTLNSPQGSTGTASQAGSSSRATGAHHASSMSCPSMKSTQFV